MNTFDLVVVGDNCIDRLSGRIEAHLVGGNAVNVAVQGSLAGLSTAYAGAVGPEGEPDGDRVVSVIRSNGVDVSMIQRRAPRTSVTMIHVSPDGERKILQEDFGACTGWVPNAEILLRLKGSRHVHIGWLDDHGATRRALAKTGVPVSQDISVNATSQDNVDVDGLTIAFASLPEQLAEDAEDLAAKLISRGAAAAVVTLGSLGSLARFDGMTRRASAPSVLASDTTGAGDSYIAGFLAARLNGADIETCMAAGHNLAAATCSHAGGFRQPA